MIGGLGINIDGEKDENITGQKAILNLFNSKGTKVEEQYSIDNYSIKAEKDKDNENTIIVTYSGPNQTLLFGDITVKGIPKVISGPPGNQMIRCKGRKGICVEGTDTGISTKFNEFKQRNNSGSITPGESPSLSDTKGYGGLFIVKINNEEIKIKAGNFSIKEGTDTDGEPFLDIEIVEIK